MKKFLVAVLVIAMVSMMGLVAFAAYPTTKDNWNLKAAVDVEAGTVTFTYDVSVSCPGGIGWVELAIYDSKPDFTGVDMDTDGVGPYKVALGRANNEACVSQHVVTKAEAKGASAYPFEEGKTHYATICVCGDTDNNGAGGDWVWSPSQVLEFKYSAAGGSDEPTTTADVSTIAFAVVSVLGCGALAVRKKR